MLESRRPRRAVQEVGGMMSPQGFLCSNPARFKRLRGEGTAAPEAWELLFIIKPLACELLPEQFLHEAADGHGTQ